MTGTYFHEKNYRPLKGFIRYSDVSTAELIIALQRLHIAVPINHTTTQVILNRLNQKHDEKIVKCLITPTNSGCFIYL